MLLSAAQRWGPICFALLMGEKWEYRIGEEHFPVRQHTLDQDYAIRKIRSVLPSKSCTNRRNRYRSYILCWHVTNTVSLQHFMFVIATHIDIPERFCGLTELQARVAVQLQALPFSGTNWTELCAATAVLLLLHQRNTKLKFAKMAQICNLGTKCGDLFAVCKSKFTA